jgi:hypothetical protein
MFDTSRWQVLAGSSVARRISRNVSSGWSGLNTSRIWRILLSTSSGRIPRGNDRGSVSSSASRSELFPSSASSSSTSFTTSRCYRHASRSPAQGQQETR